MSDITTSSDKIKIQIIKKSTGQVVDTKTAHSKKDWEFYWDNQCDSETYSFRYVGDK